MRIKQIKFEDIVNYKKTCMFIGTISCSFKCCKEQNLPITICQNESLNNEPIINIDDEKLIDKYINNPLTSAIVFGGMEPLDQIDELISFILKLRLVYNCSDDIVIYTGYNKDEISKELAQLKTFKNIIIKFGRYIPNEKSHFDEVLGINLASSNQYAERIS